MKFHNSMFILVAATDDGVKMLSLDSQQVETIVACKVWKDEKEVRGPGCHCLTFDETGNWLYTGWSDGSIRFYCIDREKN